MNISSSQVESIVRKILGEVSGAKTASAGVPKTAKVAMLTAPKKIEVKEYPIPTVGDNDILVKVEGCGVCGTDVHEWKGDPSASIASNLYRDIDLFFFSAKRITGLSPWLSFKNIAVRLLSLAVILVPFFFIDITANGWLQWMLWAIAVSIYAGIVLLVIALIFDFRILKSGIKRFVRIFKRG